MTDVPTTPDAPSKPSEAGAGWAGRGSIRKALDAGVHPATRRPLAAGKRCGSCVHLQLKVLADQSRHMKCGLLAGKGRRNGGPDLRSETPACLDFKSSILPAGAAPQPRKEIA
ncbi:hypothetical protein ACIREO_23490 [Streptomyces sp. NPDC102441]|uniref:hypothetical protein n=1 Tax=Streptomyces sp. NPDC102441 TaxID=3366176 RepID=UPI003821C5F3